MTMIMIIVIVSVVRQAHDQSGPNAGNQLGQHGGWSAHMPLVSRMGLVLRESYTYIEIVFRILLGCFPMCYLVKVMGK